MSRRRALVIAFVVVSCGDDPTPRDQWRVAISTDAPAPALVDRLLVDVVDAKGALVCPGCTRLFGLDQRTVWPISFGVVPSTSAGAHFVRARLFRSDHVGADGLPRGDMLIDALGRLPDGSGVKGVSLPLRMDCFGVASAPEEGQTCEPGSRSRGPAPVLTGGAAALAVGSWEHAQVTPCPDAAPADMICVPGGVFLLGDVRLAGTDDDAARERLVRIDPFAMDRDEMTVRHARDLIERNKVVERPGTRGTLACVYTETPDPTADELPINCVPYALAETLCKLDGKRLPTEAEWEFAAGSSGEERFVPWGELAAACEDAVVGRGRTLAEGGQSDLSTACRVVGAEVVRPAGPVAGGSPRDVTALGIRNLGGNVEEWTIGGIAPYDAPCFGEGAVLINPVCVASGPERMPRGGNWAFPPLAAATSHRAATLEGKGTSYTGLRCVKPYGRP